MVFSVEISLDCTLVSVGVECLVLQATNSLIVWFILYCWLTVFLHPVIFVLFDPTHCPKLVIRKMVGNKLYVPLTFTAHAFINVTQI